MDLFVWSGLFSLIANLGIGIFVYTRNPHERKNQLFCLFSFAVGGWSVGSFLVNIIPDKSQALWILRFNYFFGVWTPALYVHLIHSLGQSDTSVKKKKRNLFYLISILLSPIVFIPFFIPSLRIIRNTTFFITQPGPFYYIFFGYFSLAMFEVIFQIFQALKTKVGLEFRQFKFVFVANLLAVMAGFEYFLRVFGFFSRPPVDDYILILYVLVLAYGITRHRLFDVEALVRAFRKERLVTLGLLSSSINHEIKNPLFIIRGFLENCLEKGRPEAKDQETRELLEKIYKQVNRISDVIARFNQLVKTSDSEKLSGVERGSIEMGADHALEMLSLIKGVKEINISKQLDEHLPDVLMNQGELEEIFINLLVNASDAIPRNGWIKISATSSEPKVKIKIEDNGMGMSPLQLKRIFRPFYSTKGEKGVGLGLYITKQIVERRGGKISVRSKESKGTCFEIELLVAAK